MRRPYPTLALFAALLLCGGFASGWSGSGSHGRLGPWSVAAMVVFHSASMVQFGATARRVEGIARASGMPDWVGAQAEKNWCKARAYSAWGLALAGLSAGTGWAGGGTGHLVASAASFSFQVGALAGLVVLGVVRDRLIRDSEGWASPALSSGDP